MPPRCDRRFAVELAPQPLRAFPSNDADKKNAALASKVAKSSNKRSVPSLGLSVLTANTRNCKALHPSLRAEQ